MKIKLTIIKAGIFILAALISWSASTYNKRHPNIKTVAGFTMKGAHFRKADKGVKQVHSNKIVKAAFPANGSLYWSGYQYQGNKASKYVVEYKTTSIGKFKSEKVQTCRFKKMSKSIKFANVKKKKDYYFAITKKSNLKQETKIDIDILQR